MRVSDNNTIPAFSNPSGATLTMPRRLRLLALAVAYRFVIVEDDPDVAHIIEQVLNDFSFRTVWCRSAGDLLRRLRSLAPDLCIIDLGLPDMDGIEVMQRVRAQSACGIIILTGRAHISDRVMGLELGADDYILKPFEPRELVARVRSILRRLENTQSNPARKIAEFSGWHFNLGNNTLWHVEL